MADYNVTYRDTGTEALSGVAIVLIILFFPIAVIVIIVKTIIKARKSHIEGNSIKANTDKVKSEVSLMRSDELERYYELYQKGSLTEAEYNAKKNNILHQTRFTKRAVLKEQYYLDSK